MSISDEIVFSLKDYELKIKEIGFEEYPTVISGAGDQYLKDFLNYKTLDLDLRIYLTRLLICRCCAIDSGTYLPADIEWWVKNFEEFHLVNVADFTRTEAIKEAIRQVQSDDPFGKCITGTTFMFTIIEFYTKFFLGLNPLIDSFEKDKTNIEKYRNISFSEALKKLRKGNKVISREICAIDKFFRKKATNLGYEAEPFRKSYVHYRLTFHRNRWLHGENQSRISEGTFLVLLYILFTYCHLKEDAKERGWIE
jgi:hypothetical protein